VKCLGQEYSVYAGRRSLRIPNGDLLLMSRILAIGGRKGEFDQTSSIVAEYDVPSDAWYFDGEKRDRLPTSICIELALQPCGFLSAYLGTPLRYPEVDYSFRNLDGEATFNRRVDARGKTVRAQAQLLKTIFYGSTIIQHFSFELLYGNEIFFEGKSSFGYFSAEAMAAQTGLVETGRPRSSNSPPPRVNPGIWSASGKTPPAGRCCNSEWWRQPEGRIYLCQPA
jgi:hypothetical protein